MAAIAVLMTCFAAPAAAAAAAAADRDRDGLSDRFERRHSHTLARKADTDRDRLRDGVEVRRYRTNPRRADTDRDGLRDGREVRRYRTDPRRADTDRDGLRDGREVRRYRTDPRRADTDRDGLRDGREVRRYRTDPRRADTDRDGLSDGTEVDPTRRLGRGVRRYRGTISASDPRRRDTDGDGLRDGSERRLGTNPTLRDSDGDGLEDAYEVRRLGTDPLSGDSDGDGLSDGFEALLGSNARDGRSPGAPAIAPSLPASPPGPPSQAPPDGPGSPPDGPGSPPDDPESPPDDPGSPPDEPEEPDPPQDAQAPQTTILSGPSGTVTQSSASFAFDSSEAGSSFQCRIDGSSWSSCTSPRSYFGLSTGPHTFSVRARDAAGNLDPTPASRSWTIEEEEEEPDPPPPPPPGDDGCTTVATTVSQAQSAVSSAAPGATVCLADGSYGAVKLSATKSAPGVTLRPQSPGGASIGDVDMSGRFLALEGFVVDGDVHIAAKSQDMRIERNDITSDGLVVFLFGDNGTISNVEILGNRISGVGEDSGENDLIRLHKFRGVRIEGNELRNIVETGGHSDILQSVHGGAGLIFARNFVHEQGGTQGFFLKDGAVTNVTVEENLIIDDPSANGYSITMYDTHPNPSDPFYTGYGALVRRNTVWDERSGIAIRGCDHENVLVERNVTSALSNAGSGCASYDDVDNLKGGNPSFVSKAAGDYRLVSGTHGITWDPTAQHYGP